jgi:hypothetical protein
MFPIMPAEVFDAWFAPLIKSDGWPFLSEFAFPTGVWTQYLDGHSIQSIKRLVWKRDEVIRTIHAFSPDSHRRIEWIIQQHVHGIQTPVAKIKNGKGRESFLRSREYVERTGSLFAPIILIKQMMGYDIMDGNHRAAALFAVRRPIFSFDAWIGVTPK